MPKNTFNMDHVERLTRGKRSGKHIGSRAIGHHLKTFEREIYQRALKDGFIVVDERSRENLWNVWLKVAEARDHPVLILVKNTQNNQGDIYLADKQLFSGNLSKAKQEIRRLAKNA